MRGALAQTVVDALTSSKGPGAQVLSIARHVAGILKARPIQPAEPVHLLVAGRLEDLGALLGIWLAGGCAVPVHAAAAAATRASLSRATAARYAVEGASLHEIGRAPPPRRALLNEAALVLFTSGSTGQPKGVVIGEARLAGKLTVLHRLVSVRPDDRVLVPLQLTFIFGIWVSLLALMVGATPVLVPKFSRDRIEGELQQGATVFACVPSMLRVLSSEVTVPAPRLRLILAGGENLPERLVRVVEAAFPTAGLFNLYGLTETTSCDFCLTPSDQKAGAGTIGSPTEQVTFRLSFEDGDPPAPGSPGELQIRTPFAMLGYLDDPALTRASFADGFFKTGDLARLRADGRVEIVGRVKEIISRGGNKISPVEIENFFCEHPEVAAALCAGVPDQRLGEAIHVVIVRKPGSDLSAEALRAWASVRIERYRVPDGIHVRDELPLGPTGKTDRGAVARMVLAHDGLLG